MWSDLGVSKGRRITPGKIEHKRVSGEQVEGSGLDRVLYVPRCLDDMLAIRSGFHDLKYHK